MSWYRNLLAMPVMLRPDLRYDDIGHQEYDNNPELDHSQLNIQAWFIDDNWGLAKTNPKSSTHDELFADYYDGRTGKEHGIAKGRVQQLPGQPAQASVMVIGERNPHQLAYIKNRVVKILEKTFGMDLQITFF